MYGGEKHMVTETMLRSFGDIDDIIQKHLAYCEKNNIVTEMAILSLTNMSIDKPIISLGGDFILFLRYKFFKTIEGELPISLNLNKTI